jgi:hypothetical protein
VSYVGKKISASVSYRFLVVRSCYFVFSWPSLMIVHHLLISAEITNIVRMVQLFQLVWLNKCYYLIRVVFIVQRVFITMIYWVNIVNVHPLMLQLFWMFV